MQKIIRPVEERKKEIHIREPPIPDEWKPAVILGVVLFGITGIAYALRRVKK